MLRKIFHMDIYRSHPTIKVAQFYYFFTRDAWHFWAQGHDIFAFCLEFLRDSQSPAPYKLLWTTSLDCIDSLLKSHKYNLSQKA